MGAAALLWRPSISFVEWYVNNPYPVWEHALFAITSRVPWSCGDLAVAAGIVLLAWRLLRRDWLGAVAALALYLVWFDAGWGWNYSRAPFESRVDYDASRVNHAAVEALRKRAMTEINRLAAPAHRHDGDPLDLSSLASFWLPVVQAGGDTWTPAVGEPKPTLFDPFMNATATSGFINPLTLNVQLASDLLWFERPFSLAHEWTHVAGYAREDEANYAAILTCTRSTDPVQAYSGWIALLEYLPPAQYKKSDFIPLVWQDFAAIRERNAKRVNLSLSQLSWHTYNAYLKSNHVANGVENYNEVTRLYLGVRLGRDGLPVRGR